MPWAPPEAETATEDWQPPEASGTADWAPPEVFEVSPQPPAPAPQPLAETAANSIKRGFLDLVAKPVQALGNVQRNVDEIVGPVVGRMLTPVDLRGAGEFMGEVSAERERMSPVDPRNKWTAGIAGAVPTVMGLAATGGIAGAPAALGLAGTMGAQSGFETADEIGVTSPAGKLATAAGFGVAEAGIEAIGGLGAKPIIGSVGKRFIKTLVPEAVEEPLTGSAQDLITRLAATEDPNRPGFTATGYDLAQLNPTDPRYLQKRLLEAGIGAAGGTIAGGLAAADSRRGDNETMRQGESAPLSASPSLPVSSSSSTASVTPQASPVPTPAAQVEAPVIPATDADAGSTPAAGASVNPQPPVTGSIVQPAVTNPNSIGDTAPSQAPGAASASEYQPSTALKGMIDRFREWTGAQPLEYRVSPEKELDALAGQMLDDNPAGLEAVTNELLTTGSHDLGLTEREHTAMLGNAMLKWEARAAAAEQAGTADAEFSTAARMAQAAFERVQDMLNRGASVTQVGAYMHRRDPLAKLRSDIAKAKENLTPAITTTVTDNLGKPPEELAAEIDIKVKEEQAAAADGETPRVVRSKPALTAEQEAANAAKKQQTAIKRAESRASRLIYKTEERLRQGSKDLDTSKEGDSINKVFRDEVAEPMALDKFNARLAKLNVGADVAARLYKTAQRERTDQEAMDDYREGLKVERQAEGQVDKLATTMSDTPSWAEGKTPTPLMQLINDAIKAPAATPDLVARLQKLGVSSATATQLEGLIAEARKRAAVNARSKAAERLITSLSPKVKPAAKSKLPRILDKFFESVDLGMMGNRAFLDAYAQAFNLPHISAEMEAQLRAKARQARALPAGSLERLDLEQDIADDLAIATGIKTTDLIRSGWYGNILSGFGTQAANFWFNLQNLGTLVSQATGDALSGDFGSYARMLSGGFKGAQTGAAGAVQTLKTGRTHKGTDAKGNDKFGDISTSELAARGWSKLTPTQKAIYTAMGQGVTRRIMRAMSAVDVLFNQTARESAARMAAGRVLRKQGLKPGTPAFNQAYAEQLGIDPAKWQGFLAQAKAQLQAAGKPAGKLEAQRRALEMASALRPESILEVSNRIADRVTGQQTPEGSGKLISGILGQIQRVPLLGRNLAPFNRIVSNFFAENMDWTGIGLLRGALGQPITQATQRAMGHTSKTDVRYDTAERVERALKAVAGVSAGLTAYAIASAFKDMPDDDDMPTMVYGYGPENKNERAAWLAAGNRPFSIRRGNQVTNYSETVLAFPLAIAGSVMDKQRYGKKQTVDEARVALGMANAAKAIFHFGPLGSTRQIIQMLEGQMSPKDVAVKLSGVTGFIPASGLLRETESILDPAKTSNETIGAILLAGIPGLSDYTAPKLDRFGRPEHMSGWPGIRRIAGTTEVTDPVIKFMLKHDLSLPGAAEVTRWDSSMGTDALRRVSPTAAPRAVELARLDQLHLTLDEEHTFRKQAGTGLYKRLTDLKNSIEKAQREGRAPPSSEALQRQVQIIDKVQETQAKHELMKMVR